MTLFLIFNSSPMCISFTMHFDITKSLMVAANRFTTWYTEEAISVIVNCFYRVFFGLRGVVLYPIFCCSVIFSANHFSWFLLVRFSVRIRIFYWKITTSFPHVYTIAIAFPRWTYKDYWETQHGRRLGIRPRSQGLLPFQNGGQTRRKTIKFIEHKRKSQLGTKK